MQPSEKPQLAQLLAGVYEFYGKTVSPFALSVWWGAMKLYDIAAVRQAFDRHLMNPDTGQWLPKPADVMRMLGGRTQDRALMAWAKVDKAVRSVGTYASVAFDDALIHRVLHDMGGWLALGQKTEDEWPFTAKEFENRYRGYSIRNETPDYPPVLIGVAEAYNSQKGHRTELPRLIGVAELAQKVMKGGSNAPLIGISKPGDSALRLVQKNDGDAEPCAA
jgi:hypothetical protein